MQLRRNEVLTGLLVIGTMAAIAGILILLGAPGLFRPLVTYKIYMDNAAGIKLGAPVLLAGRKIGQVDKVFSPVTQEESDRAATLANSIFPPAAGTTPPKRKFEARIDVKVDRNANVYKSAKARLFTLGLLGEYAIDITEGIESSGRAEDGEIYPGERVPEFGEAIAHMLDIIDPVAKEATGTLKDLQTTAQNLNKITDEQSQLNMALAQMRTFAENLTNMTATDSSLQLSLKHVQEITTNLDKISTDLSSNDNIHVMLQNFRESSEKLKSALNALTPDLKATGQNVSDLTDTLKHQPWRLVYPATKKYPGEENAAAHKTSKPQSSPTPTPRRR